MNTTNVRYGRLINNFEFKKSEEFEKLRNLSVDILIISFNKLDSSDESVRESAKKFFEGKEYVSWCKYIDIHPSYIEALYIYKTMKNKPKINYAYSLDYVKRKVEDYLKLNN